MKLEYIHRLIIQYSIGDYASIFGVVGLLLTLWQVYRTKSASVQAKESVEHFQKNVLKFTSVSNLSSVIALVDEIKSHSRSQKWEILQFKLEDLKKKLIEVKQEYSGLDKYQKEDIERMLISIGDSLPMLNEILIGVYQPEKSDTIQLNKILNKHADKIFEILTKLKAENKP